MAKSKTKTLTITTTVFIALVFFFLLFKYYPVDFSTKTTITNTKVSVHFIDVGQGDSILIKSPNNVVLIDAGDNDSGNVVAEYLAKQKIKTIDLLIGTHPHADHIGGLDIVINKFDVKKILMPKIKKSLIPTTSSYKDVLKSIKQKDLKITQPNKYDTFSFDTFSLKVLTDNEEYDDLNDYSIVTKLTCGNFSALFPGDISVLVEDKLLQEDIKSNVLKAAHHGSSTSNSLNFLKAVAPKYCVISLGQKNKYNHPHSAVLSRLLEQKIQIFRTDKDGTIVINSDGNAFDVIKTN